MKPERAKELEYADRLSTNYDCWFFSDVTRAAAVESVADALRASEAEKAELRKALERIVDNADWACYAHTSEDHSPDCSVGIATAALASQCLRISIHRRSRRGIQWRARRIRTGRAEAS